MGAVVLLVLLPSVAPAQGLPGGLAPSVSLRPTLNVNGASGLIDTPVAVDQPDGEFAFNVSNFAGITRTTLSFQILPRVQGTFRYAGLRNLNFSGFDDYYDRSFDVSVRVLDEGRYRPAVKIGLQDFVGTGLYSGEYVVATKTVTPRLQVSAGLGWGRLAGENTFGAPFGDRPAVDIGVGGQPNVDQWFRGPVAPFGGLSFRATERLSLMVDYSSDGYLLETGRDPRRTSSRLFDRASSVNAGVAYRVNDAVTLTGFYAYGSELGVNLTFSANPYRPPNAGSVAPAPAAVAPRPRRATAPDAWRTDWARVPAAQATLLGLLKTELEPDGFLIESLRATADAVTIRLRNRTFDAEAQAFGRVVRALTRTMPPSVETFRVVFVTAGLPASVMTVRRSDVEATVNAADGTEELLAVTGFADAGPRDPGALVDPDLFPRFTYGLGPYARTGYFDPDAPLRYDLGVRLRASLEPLPGLVLSGAVTKSVVGTLDESDRPSNSRLPRVRTDGPIYDREGDPALETLTAAYYFRPGPDLYARATVGYLERMFGGVSGEVLWKPVGSRLGVGAELNYARQRDFDLALGFRDYDVMTGHASAYYELGGGFQTQVDVGRYLAGDVGATLTLEREFRNGWTVGAFATLTDVSSEDFGEGSFDKGIKFSIPVSWFTGQPSRTSLGTTLRPVTRDGGARLSVPGRLYDRVRRYHTEEVTDQWGRVWR